MQLSAFNGVNNKEHVLPAVVIGVLIIKCMHQVSILDGLAVFTAIAFTGRVVFVWEHVFKYFTSLPSFFPLLIHCDLSPLPCGGSWLGFQDLPAMGVDSV